MKMLVLLLGGALSLPLLAAVEDRDAKQAKLDAACQQAQQQPQAQGPQFLGDGDSIEFHE